VKLPGGVTLHHGDALAILAEIPDGTADAVITDPPYAFPGGFMGQHWDNLGGPARYQAWCERWAGQCYGILKPGGHLLAFGAPRTYHRLASGIEDAGLEVRDSVHWIYGSGFPKSLDVSKAIDKAAGAQREVTGSRPQFPDGTRGARARPNAAPEVYGDRAGLPGTIPVTAPATEGAARWAGWGTALKPAHEPIVVARKPLAGTVAQNVVAHGTGALNIDACRVDNGTHIASAGGSRRSGGIMGESSPLGGWESAQAGRWPPNVLLGPDAAAELDRQSGRGRSGAHLPGEVRHAAAGNGVTHGRMDGVAGPSYGDAGGASRFFPVFRYQAKAPTSERPRLPDGTAHPTVKPLELMRWLVRLVTPPGGLVLDPFAGTGTTGQACRLEGLRCVLIERDDQYVQLALQRLAGPQGRDLLDVEWT
jgi:DNA methylase